MNKSQINNFSSDSIQSLINFEIKLFPLNLRVVCDDDVCFRFVRGVGPRNTGNRLRGHRSARRYPDLRKGSSGDTGRHAVVRLSTKVSSGIQIYTPLCRFPQRFFRGNRTHFCRYPQRFLCLDTGRYAFARISAQFLCWYRSACLCQDLRTVSFVGKGRQAVVRISSEVPTWIQIGTPFCEPPKRFLR